MKSLKTILNCIGVETNRDVSVLQNFFGFVGDHVPPEQVPPFRASVSILQQIQDLQKQHLHLNIIRVGFDTLSPVAQTTALLKLDYAIYRIRNIYRQVDLGIGRILHWEILAADANGHDDLGSPDEAEALRDEWTILNNGLDVFVVRNISDTFVGISPLGGNCTKNAKDDGLIGGEINRDFEGFSRTFAHEVGHFLGLSHNHDSNSCPTSTSGLNNLMAQTRCALSDRDSVSLTPDQGQEMQDHCSAQNHCP